MSEDRGAGVRKMLWSFEASYPDDADGQKNGIRLAIIATPERIASMRKILVTDEATIVLDALSPPDSAVPSTLSQER